MDHVTAYLHVDSDPSKSVDVSTVELSPGRWETAIFDDHKILSTHHESQTVAYYTDRKSALAGHSAIALALNYALPLALNR